MAAERHDREAQRGDGAVQRQGNADPHRRRADPNGRRPEAVAAGGGQDDSDLLDPGHELAGYVGNDMIRTPPFSAFGRDLKYAMRVLRRTPVFTTTAIVTLALAIGANTAVFSLVDAILIKPLPYPEPERLAYVVARAQT